MKAGRISIDLSAGVASFLIDMERANTKLRDFAGAAGAAVPAATGAGNAAGRAFKQIGDGAHKAVTDVQAVSASLRTIEGGFNNNLRAAERFIATIGGGKIAQSLFPVAGGLALVGVLDELYQHASKAYDEFKKMQEAPQRIAQEMRAINGPIQQANDELDLTNAKLEEELNQLRGKPENGLKEALAEARVEADKLAISLDKDIRGFAKVLKQNEVGYFKGLFTSQERTDDLSKLFGEGSSGFLASGIPGRIQKITDQGNQELAAISEQAKAQLAITEEDEKLLGVKRPEPNELEKTTIAQKNEVRERTRKALKDELSDALAGINNQISKAKELQQDKKDLPWLGLAKQDGRLQSLEAAQQFLIKQETSAEENFKNETVTEDVRSQKKVNAAEELTRPFKDKLNELTAQFEKTKATLSAIGKPESEKVSAKATGEADEIIARLNNELGKHPQDAGTIPQTIIAEAKKAGIDPKIALAVAERESGTKQVDAQGKTITSPAGALGTMQLMPGTAKQLGVNPLDTVQNIQGGITYLSQLFQKYGDWEKALAAYNWGPGKVDSGAAMPSDVKAYSSGILARSKTIQEPQGSTEGRLALSQDQKEQINAGVLALKSAEAEQEWKTKLEATTTSIENRIQALRLMTEAIGKGYEAEKNAIVETRVNAELGERGKDPKWMADHQADVLTLRTKYAAEADQSKAQSSAQSVDKLSDQIELERSLASVQEQGAEAIRLVTLAYKLREMAHQKATQAEIRGEIDLFNAQQKTASAGTLAKLNEEIRATERLTAAQSGGTDAVRRAQLQNRIEEIRRSPQPKEDQDKEIEAVTRQSQVTEQQQITTEALRTGIAYQNELESIDKQVAVLQTLKATQGDSLAIEISLDDLAKRRAEVYAEQVTQLGTAKEGMRAFFQEMATEGESAAKQVHDSLKGAFDGINDELAKLMSGQKTNWAGLFQSISADLSKMALKNLEAEIAAKIFPPKAPAAPGQPAKPPTGIRGVLGTVFGKQPEPSAIPGVPKGLTRDGQTSGSALFVTMIGAGGSTSIGPSLTGGISPIGITPNLRPSLLTGHKSTEPSGAGSPGGAVGDVLTKLPSGLIQREPAANLTPEDKSNLGDFKNSELGQLARGATATTGIANQLSKGDSNTGAVLGAAGAAAVSAGMKGGTPATGKLAAFGGAKGLASTGVTLAFSLLPLLFNHRKDLHHKAGQPYTIPNFNGAFADGGPVKGGKTHLVGEKGPELFVPKTDGKIIPHHKLGSLATGASVPFGGYRALGGSVDPSQAYMVGEKGPEMWIPPAQGSIVSHEHLSGGSNKPGDVYIDARGTDPAAVEQRVRQGMASAHNAAVRTSFRATQEYAKRTPPVKA